MKLSLPIGSNFKIRKKTKTGGTTKQMLTKFSLHRAIRRMEGRQKTTGSSIFCLFLTRSGNYHPSQKIRIGLKELKGDTGRGGRSGRRRKNTSGSCTDTNTGTCRMMMVIKLRESDVTGREIGHQT